jgi:LCP family protein required for cell wall assembly
MNDHAARQRRTRRRWILILGSLLALNALVFAGYLYARGLEQAVIEVTVVPEVDAALDAAPEAGEPMTFLVLGSDSREGLPEDWDDFGAFGGERADVIILAHVLPDQGRVQLLSIPRDLRVDIPGHGYGKVNAALAYGGAELAVDTIRLNLDVPIHHYVEVDFAGFAAIVDAVGGVSIDFPHAARDLKSGLSADAGTQLLDGRQALAYARSRSYEELRSGSWTFVEANDIGRTGRQQQIIAQIMRELAGPQIVVDAPEVVSSLTRHMVVDSAFKQIEFAALAWSFREFGTSSMDAATLPVTGREIDGAWYAVPVEDEADRMLAAFRNGGSLSLTAGEEPTTVAVLNGNGTNGLASAWGDWLVDRGFEVSEVGDAGDGDWPVSQVVARSGDGGLAEDLVAMLPFGEVTTGTVGSATDLVLILGSDADFPEAAQP